MKFELEWEQLEPLLESGGRCALGFPSFARLGKLRQTSGRWDSRGSVVGDVRLEPLLMHFSLCL